MLLKATNPKDAKDEQELRQWLVNEIGTEDQRILVEFIWENHKGSGVAYVDGLAAIVRETGENGKQFLYNILEFAKKSPEVREAEQDIIKWVTPKLEKAISYVKAAGGDSEAAGRAFEDICWELEEKLRKMYPNVHRATMKGAMVSAFAHEGGAFTLNVAKLVKTLRMDDPLSVNATASWG